MRQSKRRRLQEQQATPRNALQLSRTEPKTLTQARAFREFRNGNNCIFKGSAGVGKTYIALALALEAIQQEKYDQVIILRSARSTVDIGHLPGGIKEKLEPYEQAFKNTTNKLYDDQTAYDKLKQRGTIVFGPTSYLRGLQYDNAIVIIDEAQNCSRNELHTIATRMGENSQLIVLGDKAQLDYMKNEKSGFEWFCSILERVPNVATIEFTAQDVVRSGFVRDYLKVFEREHENSSRRKLEIA